MAGLVFSATASSSVCLSVILRFGSHRGIQNALQRFSPTLSSALSSIHADINDDRSVAAAVAGVEGVVNAVSLYVEGGHETFHSVHVTAAARVARLAREAGVERLIHVSGIGSEANPPRRTFVAAGKEKRSFATPFLLRRSSALP